MTDKVALSNVSTFQNDASAVTAFNNNNAATTAAMDNTLSRDGTSPNQMGANLDMNSNRIINCVTPVSVTEPVTLGYLSGLITGSTPFNVGSVPISAAMQPIVNESTIAAAVTALGLRTQLTTNTTFFVSNSGSDANNGLTSGTAWATPQHAYDTICTTYDFRGFSVLLQLAGGTYPGITSDNFPIGGSGAGSFTIQGDTSGGPGGTSWQNVVITGSASGDSFHFGSSTNGGPCILFNYLYCNQTTGHGILATAANTMFQVSNCGFATPGHFNLYSANGALIECITSSTNTCVQNCASFINVDNGGRFIWQSGTLIYLGAPTFSLAGCLNDGGRINMGSMTFTNGGTVTGTRFSVTNNGVISTGTSGSATYLPGTVSGTTSFGGVYN